jgi:hypothetical protein
LSGDHPTRANLTGRCFFPNCTSEPIMASSFVLAKIFLVFSESA